MMDDLQQAYSAYQQALYHLRDPKVCSIAAADCIYLTLASRSQSFGMALAYYMIDMDLLSMQRKPSHKSCECSQTSKRPMKFTFVSA